MEEYLEKMTGVVVLVLPGDNLDASNAKEFRQNVAPMLTGSNKLIFDMSRLNFVDSSGLGALLSCLRQLHAAGGDLKLFGLTKPVRSLFELVRMHRIFEIYDTREDAFNSFEH
ncbi:MAG TPA: STAS domain-containing protein [Blastocatellia bacterium]|nr:STAS domain-containing protein [Blastocatellia bacterium]